MHSAVVQEGKQIMTEKYIVNDTFNMYVYVALKCGMTAYKSNEQKICSTQLWSRWDFKCPHHHWTAEVKNNNRQHESLSSLLRDMSELLFESSSSESPTCIINSSMYDSCSASSSQNLSSTLFCTCCTNFSHSSDPT